MEVIFEAIFEFIGELFFECIGWLISSIKVPKIIRILILSIFLIPLILLIAYAGFNKIDTEIAVAIICLIIALGLLFLYFVILIRIIKGKPLNHKKKERT